MKTTQLKYYFLIFPLILLSACAPAATAPASPSEIPATQLVTVDLAGPEMKVGSTWLYADGTVLVPVPGGEFSMGGDGPDNAAHPVTLGDFWIYSTKVTNGQFAYCAAIGQCMPPLRADDRGYFDSMHLSEPIVGVTYEAAEAYCTFAHARLPSEAEWEKAARGPDANVYPWGEAAPSCDLSNYSTCVGSTTPVNNYPSGKSYYQAFDMEGNALEWVGDWYAADYYSSSPATNPQGPNHAHDRVVRSSAFNSGADQLVTFNRFHSPPDTHRSNLSFRCVVDDPTYFAPFCDYPATYGTDGIGGASSGPQPVVTCPTFTVAQNPVCEGGIAITYLQFNMTLPGEWQPVYGTFEGPPGQCGVATIGAHPGSQYCLGGAGNLILCSYCAVTVKSEPICPGSYQFDPTSKICVQIQSLATAGACLPGFTPSQLHSQHGPIPATYFSAAIPSGSAGQCCAYDPPQGSAPQAGAGSNLVCETITDEQGLPQRFCHPMFPSCPAGASYDGKECISAATTELQPFCRSEALSFKDCTPGGGGGGGDGSGGSSGCQPPPGGCYGGSPNYVWNSQTCTCDCTSC